MKVLTRREAVELYCDLDAIVRRIQFRETESFITDAELVRELNRRSELLRLDEDYTIAAEKDTP